MNTLDTVVSRKKLVAFYVWQHNIHLPHSAFKGQTPDEVYFGPGDGIPEKLEAAKSQARQLRQKRTGSRTATYVPCQRPQAAEQTSTRNWPIAFPFAAEALDQCRLKPSAQHAIDDKENLVAPVEVRDHFIAG